MVIWIDCIWIVLDVAFCVYTEIELHPLTSTEWTLAGFGLLFAGASFVAEFLEREAHAKEVGDMKLTAATGNANLSGKMDLVALLGGETFQLPGFSSLLPHLRRCQGYCGCCDGTEIRQGRAGDTSPRRCGRCQ